MGFPGAHRESCSLVEREMARSASARRSANPDIRRMSQSEESGEANPPLQKKVLLEVTVAFDEKSYTSAKEP